MVNGEMTSTMKAKRGLRQGDPMSLYIFVLLMEYLNRCLSGLQNEPEFNFHPRCQKLGITHPCFANDLLLFARGDLKSVMLLRDIFGMFSEASGLKKIWPKARSYLWSGEAVITKKAMVAWDKICLPKKAGGLNLLNLRIWNQVAICKSQNRLLQWLKWDRQIQSWDLEWQWVKKMSRGKHPKRALLKASLANVVYGAWIE
ncbi:uncharacterized protein LOC132612253 [Lycium barbarum]|uniref:uncharacterized protein LOC132612253 n=1 Tax=Lycium barbarum TaxID=112863 RepID=UPI00293E6E43|nr:uncharacterized protein LOC132612253 [Lycium barbarum]